MRSPQYGKHHKGNRSSNSALPVLRPTVAKDKPLSRNDTRVYHWQRSQGGNGGKCRLVSPISQGAASPCIQLVKNGQKLVP